MGGKRRGRQTPKSVLLTQREQLTCGRSQAACITAWPEPVLGGGEAVSSLRVHALSKWGGPTKLRPVSAKRECEFTVARSADFGGSTENPDFHVKPTTFFFFFFFLIFWPHCAACGILVLRPGLEPAPPAEEAQSLNHWTTREVPKPPTF